MTLAVPTLLQQPTCRRPPLKQSLTTSGGRQSVATLKVALYRTALAYTASFVKVKNHHQNSHYGGWIPSEKALKVAPCKLVGGFAPPFCRPARLSGYRSPAGSTAVVPAPFDGRRDHHQNLLRSGRHWRGLRREGGSVLESVFNSGRRFANTYRIQGASLEAPYLL